MVNESYIEELQYKEVNTCAECGMCNSNSCNPVRQRLRNYSGVRFTSDGFDCALPVSIDSHSACSFSCKYCFSDFLAQHRAGTSRPVGQCSLSYLERLFSGGGGKSHENFRKALKYDKKKNGYPCPIQLGALTDPTDNIERQQGWFLEFAKLVDKYEQPVRLSTKGKLFLLDDYLDAVSNKPELYWVAFSIITPDDKRLKLIDERAPDATTRLKCMEKLSERGVKTSLRFRPILPGLSDATPDIPKAYKVLIEKAAEAGANAISYEVAYLPGHPTEGIKQRWREIEKITGVELVKIYDSLDTRATCMRPNYKWTEKIMKEIKKVAKDCGLTVGISDPVWKQLGETGCCCGIKLDDPVFGNWEEQSATNQLLISKRTGKEITLEDITPDWAYDVKLAKMVNLGAGPKIAYKRKHTTWADKLAEVWNNLKAERGPLKYFQGALVPVRRDENGNLVYKYRGLPEEENPDSYFWKI